MLRTAFLLAGLGAALILGGANAVRGETTPDSIQTAWVEQQVQDVTGGQVYRLDGCVTVTAPGITYISLRVTWNDESAGYGSALFHEDAPANPTLVGVEQCLSLTNADAPCASRSARYGVVAVGDDPGSVEVSGLNFSPEPAATPTPCPTPTPTATPQPTPTPSPEPTPTPSPTPLPAEPAPITETATEPTFFPSLVNGGFEAMRDDDTPYGWRKIGGEMSATDAVRAEGERSAKLVSLTESTKWLYQTVAVKGGSYYQLQALTLKNDPNVREVLLRVSWYETPDGSGSQIMTSDSKSRAKDSPTFAALDTGPVQAPPEARSAKVRLLLRPASAERATVYFDDARFVETSPPPLAAGAGSEGQITEEEPGQARVIESGGAQKPPPLGALSAWAGPTPLANARQERSEEAAAVSGGGHPLWPVLLAIGIPAAGLSVMAGNAWWRTRLAGGKKRHL